MQKALSFPTWLCRFALFALLLLVGAQEARAQFKIKPLCVGSLCQVYAASGAHRESLLAFGNGLTWPAVYHQSVLRAGALWIAAKDWTSPDGEQWPAKVVHVGPRVTGYGEIFPVKFTTISKFEPPTVTVDGLRSFNRPANNDKVDPSLKADRMIITKANTLLGVTMTKKIRAFSQKYHDNYHIKEYILTNTGNTDADEDIELPDQTVEGLYLHFQKRYTIQDRVDIPGNAWGANVMNDIVGDGMEDYEVDFRAQYTWLGNSPDAAIDPLGAPDWDGTGWRPEADTLGMLTAPPFVGTVTLQADRSATNETDDPTQPSMTGYIDADDLLTSGNDAFNRVKMKKEYALVARAVGPDVPIEGPHMYPHHADYVERAFDGDFTTPDGRPMLGKAGGWQSMFSYGPYTPEPGESVRIVIAEGVGGLSRLAAVKVGRAFKRNANGIRVQADPEAPIEFDANGNGRIEPDEVMGKNDWWWTGKDSLFQTFRRAIANYESGYSIPQAPLPPKTFTVTSGVGDITLEWTTYQGATPPGGFEIYRTRGRVQGYWKDFYQYQLIAEVPANSGQSTYTYQDEDVVRGINYFYYIQAVGEVNHDPTAMTPTGVRLKSSRYWAQTWSPARLKRAPGETVSDFMVVPNPYNIASVPSVRWPDDQDKLGFLNVPGKCVVRIYTEMGQLIRTIRHTNGSGDVYWDMLTSDRQLVVSGLYIAVVEDLETGEQAVKKFVIIR